MTQTGLNGEQDGENDAAYSEAVPKDKLVGQTLDIETCKVIPTKYGTNILYTLKDGRQFWGGQVLNDAIAKRTVVPPASVKLVKRASKNGRSYFDFERLVVQ